jgi:hypothetical protein
LARPIVLIPHLFQLADAINFRTDYSTPSSLSSRPFTVSTQRWATARTKGVVIPHVSSTAFVGLDHYLALYLN